MIVKARKKLPVFDKCVFVVNCILSAALLLSYLAPYADPQHYWVIAFLGLIYPFLLLVNALFFIYWLIRRRLLAIIPAACILIGFKIIMANFGFRMPGAVNKGLSLRDIRVIQYNVHGFGGFDRPNQQSIQDGVMALIDGQQPDVINLEEFYENIDTQAPIYAALRKITKTDYHYFKPYDYTQWDSTGVAIFSKFPIINRGVISSPDDPKEPQAIFADIKKGDYIFRMYCLHLQSTKIDDKDHQYIKDLTHRGKVSLHESKIIGRKLKDAFIKRSYQVLLVKQHMSKCPYPYIVAGDFNDTPISFTVSQMGKGIKNTFVEKGSGLGITYFGDFPNFQIDYIFASRQFEVKSYRAIAKKLSDHYPVVSDLRLRK